MAEVKLKPCPFCGGEAKMRARPCRYVEGRIKLVVRCEHCYAEIEGGDEANKDAGGAVVGVSERWNRRTGHE